jgi:hypothetical protein
LVQVINPGAAVIVPNMAIVVVEPVQAAGLTKQ